jgi:hypothetical protein
MKRKGFYKDNRKTEKDRNIKVPITIEESKPYVMLM